MTAVLEYLAAEVLETSGNVSHDLRRGRINPRHITLAVKNDEEIDKLLGDVVISQGGVKPHIEPVLLPKTTGRGRETARFNDGEE